MTMRLTRREFAILPAAGAAAAMAPCRLRADRPRRSSRAPSRVSGEPLPAVGLGTAEVLTATTTATRQKAAAVVQALLGGGGKLIDTASTYGDAERCWATSPPPPGCATNCSSPPNSKRPTKRS